MWNFFLQQYRVRIPVGIEGRREVGVAEAIGDPGEAGHKEPGAGDVLVRGQEQHHLVLLVLDGDQVHQAPKRVAWDHDGIRHDGTFLAATWKLESLCKLV